MVLAVLLAAGATVASLAGGGASDGAETAAATSTTVRERRSTTAPRRRVTSTASTIPAALALESLPPGVTAGVLLVGTPSGRVFRADLATGAVTRVDAPSGAIREAWNVRFVGGNLVASLPRGVVALSPDDLAVRTDLGASNTFYIGGSRLWLVEFDQGPPVAREVRFDSSGTQIGRPHSLPAAADVRAATEAGLVIQVGGQAFLYDPEIGTGEPLPGGSIVAASGDRIARVACDRSLVCGLVVSDLSGRELASVAPPEGAVIDPWASGSFSPDGSRLWVSVSRAEHPPSPVIVDVATGETTVVDAGRSWQGNGSWLGDWALVPTEDGLLAIGPEGVVSFGEAVFGVVQWVVTIES